MKKRLLIFLSVLIVACQDKQSDTNPSSVSSNHPSKKVILEGLSHPWSIAFLSKDVALISEKDGNLLKVNLTSKEKVVVKGFPEDLTDSIRAYNLGDNSGIFEVLLDPAHEKKPMGISFVCCKTQGKRENYQSS